MFQFPGLALNPYVFRAQYLHVTIRSATTAEAYAPSAVTIRIVEGGFPHSEIRGSKLIRSSPRLIAAYHVLHRLSAPRHPPNALKALDRSHDRCPQTLASLPKQKNKNLQDNDRKDHFCLPNRPESDERRWCPHLECRWVATSSDLFPLHNDKQRYLPSPKQQSVKPEFPG
jgi:hypothetical protein